MKTLIFFLLIPFVLNGQRAIDLSNPVEKYIKDSSAIKSEIRNLTGEDAETANRTIYVSQYTGNDTTGTGAVNAQFRTIDKAVSTIKNYIIPGVTITLSLDSGNYTADINDIMKLQLSGGILAIQGLLKLVNSGFTMGSADANDPLTYAVSGGVTASWTSNQWKYYFLKSSTNYFPITHNTTTTLSLASTGTGTEIYEAKTVITIQNTDIIPTIKLTFTNVKINFPNSTVRVGNEVTFTRCNLVSGGTSSQIYFLSYSKYAMIYCTFNLPLSLFAIPNTSLAFNNCYGYLNSNATLLDIRYSSSSHFGFVNIVLENPNTGASSGCLYVRDGLSNLSSYGGTSVYVKFVNSNVCIQTGTEIAFRMLYPKTIITNCNYVFKKFSTTLFPDNAKIDFYFNQVYGTPNTRWFSDNITELVNLASGRSIRIPGILFPELDQNQTAALTNNATTNIIIGDSIQNKTITLEYTVTRGTSQEMGKLRINNKKAGGVTLIEDTPAGDDCGLTFAVSFVTGKINLAVTTTNTSAGTMNYEIKRVLYTPLTF